MTKLVRALLGLSMVAAMVATTVGPSGAAPAPPRPGPGTVAPPGSGAAGRAGTDQMIVRFADGASPDLGALVPGLTGLATTTTTTTSTSTSTTVPSSDPSTEPVTTTTAPAVTPSPSSSGDLQLVRQLDSGAWVVKLPSLVSDTQARQLAAGWSGGSAVVSAEPDYRSFAQANPNDPRFTDQWDLQPPTSGNMGSDLVGAWDVNTGSSAVTVAVIDTGFRPHADLVGQLLPGYDFIASSDNANDGNGQDADASDPGDWVTLAEATDTTGPFYKCGGGADGLSAQNSSWHGTHVSGTIGATTNNNTGIAGINWAARIVPVRVLGKCGGYDSDIADGIRWAAGVHITGIPDNPNPARVINMSLGSEATCSSTLQGALDDADSAGALTVVSAGNANHDAGLDVLANCNHTFAVAASDQNGDKASYSNFGSAVDLTAPGNTILSTLNSGSTSPGSDIYATYQGTSMAAPHVVGVASLLLSVDSSLTSAQLGTMMRDNATTFPAASSCTTSICGPGILNAARAVADAANVPDAPTIGTAVKGGGTASVSWTAPADDGGSAITGYRVTPYSNGIAQPAQTFNSTATTQTVTGLSNGTIYAFDVAALNANGAGPRSARSNSVVPSVPPGPPVIGVASTGNASATVNWSPPASDGGAPITQYRVTPYIGAAAQPPQFFPSFATSATVVGLSNGTTYTFTVAAENLNGFGPESAHSNDVLVAAPPDAPTIGIASASNGLATLTWEAPGYDGGAPITAYRVTPYVAGIAQTAVIFPTDETHASVTGLTNGTTYTFTVAGINIAGPGADSWPSNPTTPLASLPRNTPDESFIRAVYRDYLHREPTATERSTTRADLAAGRVTRAGVVDAVVASEEWASTAVDDVFETTLGRAADARGRAFWAKRVHDGSWSTARVTSYLYASPEYFNGIGGGSDVTWVTDLYLKILHRAAGGSALSFWTSQAQAHGRSRVARSIYESDGSHRIRVAETYRVLLGRVPTSTELTDWSAKVGSVGDVALERELGATAEYFARAQVRYP